VEQQVAQTGRNSREKQRREGDECLREGNYEAALDAYESLAVDEAPVSLQYRIALCLEGLGRWDDSLEAYRNIAGSSGLAAASARFGQARAWARLENTSEAKRLLWDLVLRSAEENLENQQVIADAQHLLGLVLAREAFEHYEPHPLDDATCSHPPSDWLVENALDLVTPIKKRRLAKAEAEKPMDSEEVLDSRTGADPAKEIIEVSAGPVRHAVCACFVRRQGVAELIDRLAEAGGLGTRWTREASSLVSDRTEIVLTEDIKLAVLLAGLTDPYGLVWSVEDKTLIISSRYETGDAELTNHRLQTAHNVLKHAVLEAPDHRWSNRANIELGNLALRQGKPEVAVDHYRLADDRSSSPVNVVASYGLALALRQVGDYVGARRSLFIVADGAPGHSLNSLAFYRLGRAYMDEGASEKAAAPFRHAVSARAGGDLRAAAAVQLALAHLQSDEIHDAADALLRHRDAFEPPAPARYRNAAAFLASYTRFQTLTEENQRQEEAFYLVRSLMTVTQDYQWLGMSGALVIGRAYRDLGLSDRMAIVYGKAMEEYPASPLAREIQYALADDAYSLGDREAALEELTSLIETGTDKWARMARLKMAENALEEDRPLDCLAECRELLRQPSSAMLGDVLRLMGRAYEHEKDHVRAALCYAGDTTALFATDSMEP